MALKRFRPALENCQMASTLQAYSPSSKTLLRLARCQLALGSTKPALSTIRSVLALEPTNAQAVLSPFFVHISAFFSFSFLHQSFLHSNEVVAGLEQLKEGP